MIFTERQKQLFEFVKEQHGVQIRKYTGQPYWMHLISVAKIIHDNYNKDLLIEVALCHDLFEDTECDNAKLWRRLQTIGYSQNESSTIVYGVGQLTDRFTKENDPYSNRRRRKQKECQRLAGIDPDFQSVKYADLIDNTSSIVEHDKSFAKVYLAEKRDILNVMRGGYLGLFVKAYECLLNGERQIAL